MTLPLSTPFALRASPFLPVTGSKGAALKAAGAKSGKVILGARPEHIRLAEAGDPAAIRTTLRVKEMMGSELHLHLVAPGHEEMNDDGGNLIVRVPTVDLEKEVRDSLVAGAELYVTFEGKVMHFFDPETEENLLN